MSVSRPSETSLKTHLSCSPICSRFSDTRGSKKTLVTPASCSLHPLKIFFLLVFMGRCIFFGIFGGIIKLHLINSIYVLTVLSSVQCYYYIDHRVHHLIQKSKWVRWRRGQLGWVPAPGGWTTAWTDRCFTACGMVWEFRTKLFVYGSLLLRYKTAWRNWCYSYPRLIY